jgi:diguanylate cyclase (GGDEF)-like protein
VKTGGGDRGAEGASDATADLRRRFRQLREEATANERKWQRTLAREIEVMSAETLAQLLGILTGGMAVSYGLDAVRLVLVDPAHEIRHLLLGGGNRLADFPDVTFVDSLAGLAPQFARLRRPWFGVYVRADHELVLPASRGLRSLALLPLRRHADLGGVLAFGSRDPERFTYHLGGDFLHHLATVIAVCLENACNRARMLRAGLTDYLTGWHNRRYLEARLGEEIARAQRAESPIACLMIDVDHFKALNDTCGHLAGDEALRVITTRINARVRASDTPARFGGDEFALLLPDTSLEDALRLAERIRADMHAPVDVGADREWAVTLSIGAAAIRPVRGAQGAADWAAELLALADAALYRAKAAGRDCVMAPG